MKGQRGVYLLLPLVLLIWGLIAWRVWSATEEPESPTGSLPAGPAIAAVADSTYRPTLLLTYADPFGPVPGTAPVAPPPAARQAVPLALAAPAAGRSSLNLPVRPATSVPTVAAVAWPAIQYLGVIAHSEGKAQVALLTVNSEETTVKVGRSVQGIQVMKLFRDSVQLSFAKQQRTFYRAVGGK